MACPCGARPRESSTSSGLRWRAHEAHPAHDAYVIPLANAFRPSYEPVLHRLTALDPADPRPIHPAHPLFRDDEVRFFVDPWPWLAYLRDVDFSFGTRIHGNIAALMAGTQAMAWVRRARVALARARARTSGG